MKQYCRPCGEYTKFKNFKTGLFKYEGERVQTCKQCGYLRTTNHKRVIESEMIHIPTQTKKKNMEDESSSKNLNDIE